MAKIPEQSVNYDLGTLAPMGTFIATCIKVEDKFGVERQKFQSQETEITNKTTFFFGFQNPADNQLYKVKTFEMTISGSPRSALHKFLSQWLGHPPRIGWDYCEMEGKGAQISVIHKSSMQGKVYANIQSVSPVMPANQSMVLGVEYFPLEESVPPQEAAYQQAAAEYTQHNPAPSATQPPPAPVPGYPPPAPPVAPPAAAPQPLPAAPAVAAPPAPAVPTAATPAPTSPAAAPAPAAPAQPYNTSPPTMDDIPF